MNGRDKQNHFELLAHLKKAQQYTIQAENELQDFIRKTDEFDLWHSVRQDIRDRDVELKKARVSIKGTEGYMLREGI